ncbi:gamma-glutamyl-gamma-aminobutyrate hydrolase family protein [Pseudooceanicola sp.]|uniref:gamma-glutamyl-gamma-aminobutyrate hydrolase family protein n=1 Tax=Pseudooceanicola sp. TaxID=1914328 RepID=UPI0035C6E845
MTRPLIGVTTSSRSGWRIFPLVALNIWFAGGRAVRWGAGRPSDVAGINGIVIGGGDDISPDLYGGEIVAAARLDPDRDALEQRLVCEALDQGKPVLGICRGSQMINVALGGTLDQNAYETFAQSRKFRTILPRKTVHVRPGTRLMDIAGPEEMTVNALHSQAVDELGDGLQVAARDEGEMIQAVERVVDPFMLGVQWHPEHLIYAHRQRAIFRALVGAARAGMQAGDQIAAARRSTA